MLLELGPYDAWFKEAVHEHVVVNDHRRALKGLTLNTKAWPYYSLKEISANMRVPGEGDPPGCWVLKEGCGFANVVKDGSQGERARGVAG